MLGIILFALFSIAAVGTALALADSFVRGREVFARIRREMADAGPVGRVHVVIADAPVAATPSVQHLRPVNRAGGRPVRQASAWTQPPLAAAA